MVSQVQNYIITDSDTTLENVTHKWFVMQIMNEY